MNKGVRVILYIIGLIFALSYSYLLPQVDCSESREILLIAPVVLIGLVVFVRPLWGIFLVLLLSPLQTFGDEVLLLTRLLGMWVVVVTFARLLLVQREKIRWIGVEGPVILMAFGMSLSFFRSSDISRVAFSLLSLVSLYGFLLIVFTLVQKRDQLERVVIVFLASGIYPIVQSIIESTQPQDRTFARVTGTFTLPTGLGAFLIPIVLFAIALAFYPKLSRLKRGFTLVMFGSGVAVLLMTLSRGSIFGAMIGGSIVYVALRSQLKYRKLAVGLAAMMGIVAAWMFWPAIEGRVLTPTVDFFTTGTVDSNITIRRDEMALIIPITLDNHFIGTGIGNYRHAAHRYRLLYGVPDLPVSPHNILLYFFGEVGIFGALGFVWLLMRLARHVLSSYRAMIRTAPDLTFYVYVGSVGSLLGYISFMITHSGLFQNEIWIAMAFFFTSVRLAEK